MLADGTSTSSRSVSEVADRYDKEMQERLGDSVWASGCSSWYQTTGGRITTNWPGLVKEYRERTATFEPADYLTR